MDAVDPSRFSSSSSKARVLDAALFLFTERGYFNTSVHNVARYAGVSIGAIYHHFHDKAGIAQALYDTLLQRMVTEVEALRRADASAEGQFRAIVAYFFELTEKDPATMQFMLHAQHREFLPGQRPIYSSRPFELFREVVATGMARGELRALDGDVATTCLFGGPIRMITAHLDGALPQPLSAYRDQVCECSWRAVRI